MKKLLLFVAGAAIVGLASCDKLKNLAKINVGVQSQNVEFTIPIVAEGEQNLAEASVALNIDSIIKANNSSVGVNNIKSAKVTGVNFEILDADSVNNLGVIESAKVLLSSDTKSTPVTIGEFSGNPDEPKSSMEIPLNGEVDLADYMRANTYSYTLWAKTRRATTKEIHCKAVITYELVVGLE